MKVVCDDFSLTYGNNYDGEILLESMYLMSEDILAKDPQLSEAFEHPNHLFGNDIFDFLPNLIRPRQALIIGGMGSRSFLHADPYEWTGWNFLVEGRKLCEYI